METNNQGRLLSLHSIRDIVLSDWQPAILHILASGRVEKAQQRMLLRYTFLVIFKESG
jgi:hypothetical protein